MTVKSVAASTLFKQRLNHLIQVANELPPARSDIEGMLGSVHLEPALATLKAARKEPAGGRSEAAWDRLAEAAEVLGKRRGWADAREHFTNAQGVTELLRERGRKGGREKGRRSEAKRDELAKAILNAAPKGGWRSIPLFEMMYHDVIKTVPGIRDTAHQLRKIMLRPDIRKVLPCGDKERDMIASYIIDAAPKGGFSSMARLAQCFERATQKVPGFRDSLSQRRKIFAREDVLNALSPAVREHVRHK